MDMIDVIIQVGTLAGAAVRMTLNAMSLGTFELHLGTRWAWDAWWLTPPVVLGVYFFDRRRKVKMRNAALKRGWKTVIMAENDK